MPVPKFEPDARQMTSGLATSCMARLLALFVDVGITRPLRGDSLALALGAAIIQRLQFTLVRRACCLDALCTAPLPALFQDIIEFLTGACNRLLHRMRGVEDVDGGVTEDGDA